MKFNALTEYLDSLEKVYGVPQTDMIIKKGYETIYRHQTGFNNPEKTEKTSGNELYWIYSCSKIVTMTAVMQLVEQGKIHLYDPLFKFLPEYEYMKVYNSDEYAFKNAPETPEPVHYAKNQIKIIDMMSMCAGFTYRFDTPEVMAVAKEMNMNPTTRQIVRELAKSALVFEPGTRMRYSLAHDIMGAVVEVVSGMRFYEYLKENIFKPCGSNDMCFTPNGTKETRIPQIYNYIPDKRIPVPTEHVRRFSDAFESGGGGLLASVEDYSNILAALANGGVSSTGKRILKEETVKMFSVPVTFGQPLIDFEKLNKGAYSYGLGVRVKTTMASGKSPIGEFGWDGAAGAYALIDPVNHISVFYAQHILGMQIAGDEIHPRLRDLVYECIEA